MQKLVDMVENTEHLRLSLKPRRSNSE